MFLGDTCFILSPTAPLLGSQHFNSGARRNNRNLVLIQSMHLSSLHSFFFFKLAPNLYSSQGNNVQE